MSLIISICIYRIAGHGVENLAHVAHKVRRPDEISEMLRERFFCSQPERLGIIVLKKQILAITDFSQNGVLKASDFLS